MFQPSVERNPLRLERHVDVDDVSLLLSIQPVGTLVVTGSGGFWTRADTPAGFLWKNRHGVGIPDGLLLMFLAEKTSWTVL